TLPAGQLAEGPRLVLGQPDAVECCACHPSFARARATHHDSRASAPIVATSRALTGKSSRERSVCGTSAQRADSTVPARAGSVPTSTLKSVVLPPPLGPSTPSRCPGETEKETLSSAFCPAPYPAARRSTLVNGGFLSGID